MTFHSILFKKLEDRTKSETLITPAFFTDLNLDQIINTVTAGRQEYNLEPFFYTPLNDIDSIQYRHEIMLDLENKALFEYIKSFTQKMRTMREHLVQADKLHYKHQKERWFLDSAQIYCEAVRSLLQNLIHIDLQSRGFLSFREFLTNYTQSNEFTSLLAKTKKLTSDLSTVKYCMLIKGNSVKVRKCESEFDYSADIEKTFAKFKQDAVKDYRVEFSNSPDMNHVEANVLDLVARLYPDIFSNLSIFYDENASFPDETITVFTREIQFYISFLDYIAIFQREGLKFCYPKISISSKEISNNEGFDLALAYKLITERTSVVCNDFYLKDKERIFVVSGPNQGGKTTFARTFGQLHYLASVGCLVPGSKAKLFLFDNLFTHFEREENIQNLSGKLQDDLVRIYDILNHATSHSIIIMNEIFSSTALKDAIFLSKKVMEKITQLDILCVYVTFIDELASFNEKTVSLVSTIVPANPALRTYKIVRRPADGLSYALSIAEKYQLTYDCLKERIK